jgi:5-methylcytosine-specific restriction endonuclease McrA
MGSGRIIGSESHKWSDWDDQRLRSNAHLGLEKLCEYLQLRPKQITMRAHTLGISIRKTLEEPNRPVCRICQINLGMSKGRSRTGRRRYMKICSPCRKFEYRQFKKMECELCGFEPEWIGQLDVDHIDGNHLNNDPANLMTLCANCHRLKTHKNRDYDGYQMRSSG